MSAEPSSALRQNRSDRADRLAQLIRRWALWSRRVSLGPRAAYGLAIAALLSGIATYIILTRSAPFGPSPNQVLVLVNVNLALLLLLAAVIARRVVQLWADRRRGSAGSRLHGRLVMLFSLVAVTPAIIVAVFAVPFFNFGIQSWFSDQVRTALKSSLVVAKAYLDEQQEGIRADVLAMAQDLGKEQPIVFQTPVLLQSVVQAHSALRGLPEVMVFEGGGGVLARSGLSFALAFEPVPPWAIEKARSGEVAIMTTDKGDRVRALVQLGNLVDTYLYVGRFIEPGVLGNVSKLQGAVSAYEQLEGQRSSLQINFAMLFAVMSLLLLLAAVWVGLMFATQLIRPIGNLIAATERVRAGDLAVRVEAAPIGDEIGTLSRAFNRMTSQIESQQKELIEANRQLDTRRRFTEAVLSGVSSGVIGLDEAGRINLPNRSASTLLSADLDHAIGRPLAEFVPELGALIEEATSRPRELVQTQIQLTRDRRTRTLLVRVAPERTEGGAPGYVLTFDDITELLSAQRKAAWADVARRIAHEIKNPLTPIQLSAERLKRKYLKEIQSDREIFENYTDTIVRQVGDIGRMVDEFSAFARMPAPVMKPENLAEICNQAIFLQRTAHPDIVYSFECVDGPAHHPCDGRQIGQALTNLLQNAADSILARPVEPGAAPPAEGRIATRIARQDGRLVIEVEDNGIGLPEDIRDRLTEPYVTTRTKGTGLGLAIVRKIMEDHGGEVVLDDRAEGGACVRLIFAAREEGGESGSADGTPKAGLASHAS
ncbi:MAG: PAS domain-containing sensor histidine kinase [Alphaproteobacteria bacterium]